MWISSSTRLTVDLFPTKRFDKRVLIPPGGGDAWRVWIFQKAAGTNRPRVRKVDHLGPQAAMGSVPVAIAVFSFSAVLVKHVIIVVWVL